MSPVNIFLSPDIVVEGIYFKIYLHYNNKILFGIKSRKP
jgi:hypothetical protein